MVAAPKVCSVAPSFKASAAAMAPLKSPGDWIMTAAVCREGFSVLFYGFGSKKGLLERLAQQHLTDGGLVAFNGFVPTLTLRIILSQVATLLRTPRCLTSSILAIGTPDVFVKDLLHAYEPASYHAREYAEPGA